MNDLCQARVDQPLELGWTPSEIDPGDAAFAQADGASTLHEGLRMAVPVAVSRYKLGQEAVKVGVMANDEDPFAPGVLRDELLNGGAIAVGSKGGRNQDW